MAYNSYFPAAYQPMYPQYQYQPSYQQYQQQAQQTAQMTPPTIRAEILQVDDEAAANNYPVAAGASQMMIAKDDSAIFVKTAYANGGYNLDVFEKRPPAAPTPVFDPAAYVTKDELENRLAAILEAQSGTKRAVKREAAE